MRADDAANGRTRLTRLAIGLAALAVVGFIAIVSLAQPAAGQPAACTDELYPPKTALQLGSWMSSLGKGHVGCLHAGTYGSSGVAVYVNPSVARGSESDRMRVRGYPGEALPQIVGGIYFSPSADYITLRMLKVNGSSFGDHTIGLAQGADHVWLADLDVTNQNRSGVHGCITSGGAGLIVNRSLIHGCGGAGSADHCIYLSRGAGTIVANNVVYGCGGYAVYMSTNPDRSYVHHNVLDSSGEGVMFGGGTYNGTCEATDSARVQNNAITNSSVAPAVKASWGCALRGTGNVLQTNCFWGNAAGNLDLSAGGVSSSGNIDADPQYQPGRHIPLSSKCYALVGDPAAKLQSSNTYFPTKPSGASGLPQSDSYCRSQVAPSSWEPRPDNYPANSTVPAGPVSWSNEPDSTYWTKWIAKRSKVTGNYTGTTDQIFRWGACKWGIDENLLRAVAVQESDWHQSTVGDVCGPVGRASYGIMQVKNADCAGNTDWGGYPDTLNKTALNVDFYGAYIRSCFDGDFYDGGSWLYNGKSMPQILSSSSVDNAIWGCVGSWFSGDWYDAGAVNYIGLVKQWLAAKTWLNY